MTYIVDRRLNGKNKSSVNRQRFLQRYRAHIQKAVSDAVTGRKLTDLDTGEKITIPKKEISEPLFQHGTAGNRRIVHPGNKEFVTGDKIPGRRAVAVAVAAARPATPARARTRSRSR